jgi:hypothetical protein
MIVSQRRKCRIGRALWFDQLEDRRLLSASWSEYDGDDLEGHDDEYADESKPTDRIVLHQRSAVSAADDSESDDALFGNSQDHEHENEVDDSQLIAGAAGSGWSDDAAAAFESVASDIDTGSDSLGTLTTNDLLRAIYSNSTSSKAQSQNLFETLDSQGLVDDLAESRSGSLPVATSSSLGSRGNSGLVAVSDTGSLASSSSLTANSAPTSSSAGSMTTSGGSEAAGDESESLVRTANETSKISTTAEATGGSEIGAETNPGESDSHESSPVAANRSEVETAKFTDAENDQPAAEGRETDAAVEASATGDVRSQASPQELKSQEASRTDASQSGPGSGAAGGTPAATAGSSHRTGVSQRQSDGLPVSSGEKAEGAASASRSTADNSREWQLCTALPADLGALEATLKNLFAGRVDHQVDLLGWIRNLDAFDWTIVVAIALLAVDAARRKKHPLLVNNAFPFEGQDELLRLFPEFFGIRALR